MGESKERMNGYCKFRNDSGECANFRAVRQSGLPVWNASVECGVPEERRRKCAVPIITRQMGLKVEIKEEIIETPAA